MADQTIAYIEEMVGSRHPSKADTLNRITIVEHNTDGTHSDVNAGSLLVTSGVSLNFGAQAAGDIFYDDGSALVRIAKSDGQMLFSGSVPSYGSLHKKNLLINGCQRHAQRGASGSASFTSGTTPANSDDTYLIDRFLLLSDGNDIVDVTQQTLGGVNSQENYVRLDVETTGKKFAYGQIIENKNCKSIIGGTASASVELKVTNVAKLSDVRVVVLSWDNGIDTPTSDWVSAWEAQGTVPTPIANWTAENVATDLNVTTSWVKYKVENISIDSAGADNVAMFVYSNAVGDNDTAGIFLEIANMQLEEGAVTTDFEYRDAGHELSLCQRRYNKTYDQNVVPGTADTDGTIYFAATAVASADHDVAVSVLFPVTMASTPTIVIYDAAGTAGKVTMADGDNRAATAARVGFNGIGSINATNGAVNTTRLLQFHITADGEL